MPDQFNQGVDTVWKDEFSAQLREITFYGEKKSSAGAYRLGTRSAAVRHRAA
jgi:hypothetical protein